MQAKTFYSSHTKLLMGTCLSWVSKNRKVIRNELHTHTRELNLREHEELGLHSGIPVAEMQISNIGMLLNTIQEEE